MVNTKHQKKKMGSIDYGVFYVVIVLLAIGVVMVYSASSYYAMYHDKVSSTYYLVKQAISAVAGFIAMFFFMSVDYHLLKR